MPPFHFEYSNTLQGREIRLLHLHPGQENDPIRCSLIQTSLEKRIPYYALSYVWGDPSQTRQVICDDLPYEVTLNLYTALKHIREKYSDKLLWADAMCINQADVNEKTRQVRMMGEIYSRATMVIIWLGEEAPGDRGAYRLALDLYDLLGDTISDFQGVMASINRVTSYETDSSLTKLIGMGQEWNGLNHLLMRPWFTRVWVIQELLMAKSTIMLTGNFEMETKVLLSFSSLATIHPTITGRMQRISREDTRGDDGHLSCVSSLRGLVATRRSLSDLILSDVLALAAASMATDPRDRIFALIGLSTDVSAQFIDYSRDRMEIVIDLATRLIRDSLFPTQKLCWFQTMKPSDNLPSWATDWTGTQIAVDPVTKLVPFNFSSNYGRTNTRFESSKVWPQLLSELCLHLQVLVLTGKFLDTIEEFTSTDPINPKENPERSDFDLEVLVSDLSSLHSWVQEIFDMCRRKLGDSNGDEIHEAVWRSIICNGAPYEYPAPADYGDAFDKWVTWLREAPSCIKEIRGYAELEDDPPESLMERYRTIDKLRLKTMPIEKLLHRVAYGRRFCTTKLGHVGWAPQSARVGDEVVTFSGGHVPFVVRRLDGTHTTSLREQPDGNDNSKRQLVGDGYLHGLVGRTADELKDVPIRDIFLA